MDSFKRTLDSLDLEIIDRVYEVAWAHVEAREPDRNIEALRPEVDFRLFAASLSCLRAWVRFFVG
jgi:hypothetical protein